MTRSLFGLGYGRGGAGAAAWTPADIPNIVDWWDAAAAYVTARGGGAPSNGSFIESWVGRVNGESVDQATEANQPTWLAAGHNSQPTVNFVAATSQYLQGAFGASATQPVYVAAVVDQHGGSSNGVWDGVVNEVLYFTDVQHKMSAGAFSLLGGTPNRTSGQAQIYEAIYNGASSQLFIDGVQQGSDVSAGTNAMDGLTIGARKGAAQFMDGEFGSVVVVDAIPTSGDRASLLSYWSDKFNITVA